MTKSPDREQQLAAAYARCAAIAAEHGRSYHLATRLLSADRRPAVHALYAAARTADDFVDVPGTDPAGDLATWSKALLDELEGGWSDDPVRLALVHTYRRYAIPVEHLVDFLAAMTSDLDVTGYADLDWPALAPRYREELMNTLETRGWTGIGDAVEVEELLTPDDWAAQGMAAGTPFALAHTFWQTGPFRPSTLPRKGPENVVLAGSSVQPGVGVPMVVISGRLAAERITGRA